MKILTALGISIGVLAGALCILCNLLGDTGISWIAIAAWPGFVAWACYFAIGGETRKEKLTKVMASNTVGVLWGWVMVFIGVKVLGFMNIDGVAAFGVGIAVVIGAFFLCVEANISILSFVPGAFCGCASAFGFGAAGDAKLIVPLLLSMWVGAVLALASDVWGNAMVKAPGAAPAKK
ncbi:MAG: DUF1097 domain-containing protein [Oscillospiraceae bacterium]